MFCTFETSTFSKFLCFLSFSLKINLACPGSPCQLAVEQRVSLTTLIPIDHLVLLLESKFLGVEEWKNWKLINNGA
jgi:hypothetical protein